MAILVAATIVLTWEGKRRKSPDGAFPALEVTGAVVAAVGWAFTLPGSPLTPYLQGSALVVAPLVIAFAAVAGTAITAGGLLAPRRSAAAAPRNADSAA